MINSNVIRTSSLIGTFLVSGTVFASGERIAPIEYTQFQSVLAESKLQVSDPNEKSGNKVDLALNSDFTGIVNKHFYVDKNSEALVFKMKGYKNRSEVRVMDNFDTSLPNTFYHLTADILPVTPSESVQNSDKSKDAMTYLQIHNSGDGTSNRGQSGEGYIPHPLMRVVYEADRSGKKNHYWAIIKNNAVDCGSKSGNKGLEVCKKAYIKLDLGPIDTVEPTRFDIIVGNSKMLIDVDGETKVDHDITYWKKQFSYFKAGVYNQFKNGTSEAHFYSLDYKVETK